VLGFLAARPLLFSVGRGESVTVPRKTVIREAQVVARSPIGRRKVDPKDEWGGYVQCDIGEAEREAFDIWLSESATLVEHLVVDALACGLKLTLVWDSKNECFIATLTGRPDINGEAAFTCSLSARAGDMPTAMALLVYKHREVMGEDWTEWLINGSRGKRSFG